MADKEYKYAQSDEFGRSMIEIIGVLAIMGLLTAGTFVLIRAAMANQKRARAIDEVSAIVENVRSLYASSDNFSGLPIDDAYGTKLVDGFYLNYITPFGKETRYSVVQGFEGETFKVLLTNLSDEDCMELAEQTWPEALDASCDVYNGIQRLAVNFGK